MDSPMRSVFQSANTQDGLAEWSSRIKELQRLVDADEENEQKKLQNEIAASRLARVRRSRVGGSRNNSVDIDATTNDDLKKALSELEVASSIPNAPDKSPALAHSQTLEKLVGSPVTSAPSGRDVSLPRKDMPKKAESISLAAFMGGSAPGPRLRKHAPQQDAHDPTQFEQRTRTTAPHPIFGSGGVAMPGLASKDRISIPSQTASGNSFKYQPSFPNRSPVVETQHTNPPPRIGSVTEASERLAEASKPRTSMGAREVEHIEPGIRFTASPATTLSEKTKPQLKAETSITIQPITPSPTKPLSAPSRSNTTFPPSITSNRAVSSSPSPVFLPRQPTTTPPRGVPVQPTSLARPIKPEPRLPSQLPKIPPSQNPSPAFLKPQSSKDPTPSLSRLKGRGFVKNMIKVSTELESSSSVTLPISPPPPDRPPSTGGKRVLDRWQPSTPVNKSSSPPPPALKPLAMRKSTGSTEPPLQSLVSPQPLERQKRKSLPGPSSMPNLPDNDSSSVQLTESMPPEGSPGLGSGNTLISYMKPALLNGPSFVVPRAKTPSSGVDEHDIRIDYQGKPQTFQEDPSQSNKLIHPTKSRARKPKKPAPAPSRQVQGASSPPHTSSMKSNDIDSRHSRSPSPNRTPHNHPVDRHPLPSKSSSTDIHSRPGKLNERQLSQPIIGTRSFSAAGPDPGETSKKQTSVGHHVAYRALPGLATPGQNKTSAISMLTSHGLSRTSTEDIVSRGPLPPSPASPVKDEKPMAPNRHTRIPSTGNRATVMDVAQALNNSTDISPSATPVPLQNDFEPELLTTSEPQNVTPPVPLSRSLSPAQMEKRKSSYEKYSAFILPPLKEEITPANSPANTLSRTTAQAAMPFTTPGLSPTSVDVSVASISEDVTFTLEEPDAPLPRLDIASILSQKHSAPKLSPAAETISTEVIAIHGNATSHITRDMNVLYDTEVLAIVLRSKSRSSGLVSSTLWGWKGKKSQLGEGEARRLQELAKQFGTYLVFVEQYSEPPELLHALGGTLAIRQGVRSRWSADNTTMHLVRSSKDAIFIDERDLSINNLCSGFAYCLSILSTIYVWYGRGSRPRERAAALKYAQSLSGSQGNVNELTESENGDDEMFWMILGTEPYANADYWRWRPLTTEIEVKAWRIDAKSGKNAAYPLATFAEENFSHAGVFLLDCVWELFVVVGADAREQRHDIRLAIELGMQICDKLSSSRPYTPTLHVVILPSKIPLDLRMHFREFDTDFMNGDYAPDHMNILTSIDALEHLTKTSWPRAILKDHSILPLGLGPRTVEKALS